MTRPLRSETDAVRGLKAGRYSTPEHPDRHARYAVIDLMGNPEANPPTLWELAEQARQFAEKKCEGRKSR